MTGTREKLIAGALQVLRTKGIAGVSARGIAAAAQANQALVFYHFGSVDDLLAAACRSSAEARVADYRDRFSEVDSLSALLELGGEIHAAEREAGNVAVLAQLLAGGQSGSVLSGPTAGGLALWTAEVEQVLHRVLADSPLLRLVDPHGMATLISATFIGVELVEGVDPAAATNATTTLERLGELLTLLDGPLAKTVLRHATRKLA